MIGFCENHYKPNHKINVFFRLFLLDSKCLVYFANQTCCNQTFYWYLVLFKDIDCISQILNIAINPQEEQISKIGELLEHYTVENKKWLNKTEKIDYTVNGDS